MTQSVVRVGQVWEVPHVGASTQKVRVVELVLDCRAVLETADGNRYCEATWYLAKQKLLEDASKPAAEEPAVKVSQVWQLSWYGNFREVRVVSVEDGVVCVEQHEQRPVTGGSGMGATVRWWQRTSTLRLGRLLEDAPAEEPAQDAAKASTDDRYPHRCQRGHRAYQGIGLVECPTCEAIARVAHEEPDRGNVRRVRISHHGALGSLHEEYGWCAATSPSDTDYEHPTRAGAIALWREARVRKRGETTARERDGDR